MKTLYVILYIIGAIMLIISCFTNTESATWWIGGISLVCLIIGFVIQFLVNYKKN